MIIKHKSIKTETTTDRTGKKTTKTTESMDDLSTLTMGKITWEGSRLQVARRLEFQYAQDARDPNLPNYVINCGETVYGYDEDGNLQFQGNVYSVEKNVQASTVKVLAYDNLFILTRSKTTRKFSNIKAVPVCTDPAAQFPDSFRQRRIIARICSKIDRDVHGISPFVFSILPRSGPIEKGHPLANAAALWYS